MERYEMAELLAKKAGVSLEQARDALEQNNWDMLDAMVALERAQARSSTVNVDPSDSQENGDEWKPRPVKNISEKEPFFTNGFQIIWGYIKALFKMTITNDFVVVRHQKQLFRVPVLVMIVLIACAFWVCVPLLVVGLFCGVTYRLEGKEFGKDAVNRAMDKASDLAEDIKEAFRQNGQDGRE